MLWSIQDDIDFGSYLLLKDQIAVPQTNSIPGIVIVIWSTPLNSDVFRRRSIYHGKLQRRTHGL